MQKNILRILVKFLFQTDKWLKSYDQKTIQKGTFNQKTFIEWFFGHNLLTIYLFEMGISPMFLEYFSAF